MLEQLFMALATHPVGSGEYLTLSSDKRWADFNLVKIDPLIAAPYHYYRNPKIEDHFPPACKCSSMIKRLSQDKDFETEAEYICGLRRAYQQGRWQCERQQERRASVIKTIITKFQQEASVELKQELMTLAAKNLN